MLLRPTAKAHRELHSGAQTLTMRERSVLLFAQHRRSAPDLARLFHGTGAQIVAALLEQGYLAPDDEAARRGPDSAWKSDIKDIEPTHEDR